MEYPANSEKQVKLLPLVQMVVDGKKPGALVDRTIESHEYSRLGLDVVPVEVMLGERLVSSTKLAVGRPEKVSRVLTLDDAVNIPQIEERVSTLLDKIKDMNVAPALNYLSKFSRVDNDFDLNIGKGAFLEKPEVAFLMGKLLGYRDCCIKYYIGTRYLGLPKDEVSEQINNKRVSDNPHIRCPECVTNERFD